MMLEGLSSNRVSAKIKDPIAANAIASKAMAEAASVANVSPVASRAETIARLRAHEAEIRAMHASALYLFGSAARDELGPDSDVDVFIDYDSEGSFSFVEWVRLSEFLPDIVGRDVDFTSRDGLHRLLRDEIEREAIRIF